MNRSFIAVACCLWLIQVEIAVGQISRVHGRGVKSVRSVTVANRALAHTTQLYPKSAAASPREQVTDVLGQCVKLMHATNAATSDLVKLSLYVANPAVSKISLAAIEQMFGKSGMPAVTIVQTRLPDARHVVACDAVFAVAHRGQRVRHVPDAEGSSRTAQVSVLPIGDTIYISGQAARGTLRTATRETLQGLQRTLKFLGLDKQHVVEVKTFMKPMAQARVVNSELGRFFGDKVVPAVSHVEWISSLPIEIEMVVAAPAAKASSSVTYVTPPWMKSSPVFSRVARIHGSTQIFIAGHAATQPGDGAEQVADIFASLRSNLALGGTDTRHLAKATYYVSRADSSRFLNRFRPTVYDPQRPPAASKAMVQGMGLADRSITIDLIAAPPLATERATKVKLKVVKDTSTGDFRKARRVITGNGTNDHPPYPGCTGFVGWESVTRLKSGDLICSFSAGYWHVSFPTPINLKPPLLKQYQRGGFPKKVHAPTGGRALWCRSRDNGKTWSRPQTLIDTPGDDRHPVMVELADGTLVCSFFVIDNWYGYAKPPQGRNKNSRVAVIRSTDGGKTWSKPKFMPSPFGYYDRMCGKPTVLPNGYILMPTYGKDEWTKPEQLGVYRSRDKGVTWEFLARERLSQGALDEPAICRAKNGQLVMVARPNGHIAFSRDEGQTWSKPKSFGIKMVAPCLLTQRDGTVVCIFGSSAGPGIQIMWSDDHGHTWIAPTKSRGFHIDTSVYVYAIGQELPDGSIYVVYYDPQGKQRRTAIRSIRLKIRPDRHGIDILSP